MKAGIRKDGKIQDVGEAKIIHINLENGVCFTLTEEWGGLTVNQNEGSLCIRSKYGNEIFLESDQPKEDL